MQLNSSDSFRLPSKIFLVKESRIFAHPTRLASVWREEVMEIVTPERRVERPEVKIDVEYGKVSSMEKISSAKPASFKSSLKRILRGAQKLLNPQDREPICLDKEKLLYDARWDTDRNICHILHNQAPQPLTVKQKLPHVDVTVILREAACEMALETYQLLGLNVLRTDRDVIGSHLVGTQGINGMYEPYYPQMYGDLQFDGYLSNTPERIFIARRKARSILNESDVDQFLSKYGFVKYYYEDIPISEQWSLTRNARAIVACHGAALGSLAFNQRGVKLVELFHPGYVTHSFRNTTFAAGGEWCAVTGKMPPDLIGQIDYQRQARTFASANMAIDISALKRGLEYLGL
jgi:hypothetical protein